jgi:hypothetical protein
MVSLVKAQSLLVENSLVKAEKKSAIRTVHIRVMLRLVSP